MFLAGGRVSARLNLVTGATGLVGSHVAEQLVARGQRVRALVRPGADAAFLRALGVELAAGDLGQPATLRAAVEGADVVYHCAARVADWGPWRLFQQGIVDATANLLGACRAAGAGRLLHVSSIIVYGHPPRDGPPLTEASPLGQRPWLWDYYHRAKAAAEELVRQHPGDWTVVRPSWTYGTRDRNSLPRVVAALRAGRVRLIGRGDNRLNVVYAADVADGAIRAANHPGAVGQAYNLSSEGAISQSELVDALTDLLGLPRVRRHVPYALAFAGGFVAEAWGRALRRRQPPTLTRYAVALVGRPTRFSIAKARAELGWAPQVHPLDGLRRALDWYLGRTARPAPAGAPERRDCANADFLS
jgi:nucleoside-diphosphate-sugar epimerase